MLKNKAILLIIAILLGMSACSSTKAVMRPHVSEYKRVPSYAIPQNTDTTLKRALAPRIKSSPGKSGFHILETGSDSLEMRMAMIHVAEKSIDLQYYAIHDDVTSNLLLEAMLRAAARGVRIRFLIDGVALDEVADSMSALDGIKNIEIRVFNPMFTRDQNPLSRLMGVFTETPRMGKRMHNKLIISDNQAVILGGRNLGDEYFDSNPDANFKDIDILAVGPITAKLSESFDEYWNSDDAFPMHAMKRPKTNAEKIKTLRLGLKKEWEDRFKTEQGRKLLDPKMIEDIRRKGLSFVWAKSEVVADDPIKISQEPEESISKPFERMAVLLKDANKEFLMASPYFVPQKEGVTYLSGLVKRGMRVKVLTNSLASTDVVLAHTGYEPYREDIVKNGIDLYELKPISGKRPKQRFLATSSPAHAALHTKVYIIDRKDALIGSFNFDPRSFDLNTEVGIVVHSPEISNQLVKMFQESAEPQNSYHILQRSDVEKGKKGVVWVTEEKGEKVIYTSEPKSGFWRKVQSSVMSLLPVEDQL